MKRSSKHPNQNTHTLRFEPGGETIQAPTGLLLSEAMRQAGIDLNMPCGGQGRCGRCAVIISPSDVGGGKGGVGVRRRSTLRLSAEDVAAGYALACQTVIEGDVVITIPPQEKIERRLTTDKTAGAIRLPFTYDPAHQQPLRCFPLTLEPPSMADSTDDWSRLKRALAVTYGLTSLTADLSTLRQINLWLREYDWTITALIELDTWDSPTGPPRLVALLPLKKDEGREARMKAEKKTDSSSFILHPSAFLYGVAVDIGTTTVSLALVDLLTSEVAARAAEYNGQIRRGEDVISRIIYAGKTGQNGSDGLSELQALVVETINGLIERAARRVGLNPGDIYKMTVAGNSTMMHLLLGLPPASIRLEPFITTLNQPPPVRAEALGLKLHPQATVDCLPGVASYMGADITAGVVGAQMCVHKDLTGLQDLSGLSPGLTLFLDIGTNGEMVLGDGDWLVSCACSAGPAFEGAGVQDGMRATTGAIEEIWLNSETFEPTYRVIPQPKLEALGQATPPRGICGSGLIALLAELFITGVIDKRGNFNLSLAAPNPKTPNPPRSRLRPGEHGPEYVVAWAAETAHGRDIVITKVDIDNLMRAKGAIYAGCTVLAQSVGLSLSEVERVLIGGSFGQYLNIEKAIQIGLLPDLPWEKFQFLGNTALRGTLLALLNREYRQQVTDAAAKMTYLELSADNSFYEQFMSALFLPHTDLNQFPTVAAIRNEALKPQFGISNKGRK